MDSIKIESMKEEKEKGSCKTCAKTGVKGRACKGTERKAAETGKGKTAQGKGL